MQKIIVLILVLVMGLWLSKTAFAGGDWNDDGINWQPYEQGLAMAKEENKPVCLIFYTEWCPHCINYSKIFHNDSVVEHTKQFVMIRIDKDKHPDLSKKYAPDGQYIPRTYFLSSAGALDPSIHATRDRYKYFYDEQNPAALLAGMSQALQKLR
ncbi:MAG TPA: thioredoxin family protein [Pyrinomonadaceae bacterium]|nr:thioredoxin family protein [Pyrinomonadaceae bacterium]